MNGKLIVIEGLDGSGKNTQAQRLADTLAAQGCNVRKISFPQYDSPSSALVKMYLAGDFGKSADSVNAYAASSFYAVDRYATFKGGLLDFYQQGGIIIADRYTTSNAIHQCSKLPEEEWKEFTDWLFHYEYELLGIPAPDKVIYLRVDTQISQKLMTGRYNGDDTKKDIHERDVDYLMRSRKAADFCVKELGWLPVECCKDGAMRTIDDIAEEILTIASCQAEPA